MTSKRLDLIDDRLAKALSHPLRRRILRRLAESPASPNEMSEAFGKSLTDVAYHVRALDKLGCLRLVDTAQRRGATEHFYAVKASAFVSARDWEPLPAAIRAGLASRSLSEFLSHAIPAVRTPRRWEKQRGILHWFSTTVDKRGWDEMGAAVVTFLVEVMEIAERSGERLPGLDEDGVTVVAGGACFESRAPGTR